MMSDHESQPVFFLNDRVLTLDDVFDAAHFRGELQACWRELIKAVACEQEAQASGRKAPISQVQNLSDEFRYSHDLVTTEETENWLKARGIANSEFENFFLRSYWTSQDGGNTSPPIKPLTGATSHERELLRVHSLMSGDLIGMARRLGHREAVWLSEAKHQGPDDAAIADQRERLETRLKESGEDVPSLMAAVRRGPEWLEEQLRLEALFSRSCQRQVSPERLRETLSRLWLQLITIDYEVMEVDTYHAAREVYLNLTLDGVDMEELADEYRFPYHRTRSYLEKLPGELQQVFISSPPGTVLPPANDQLKVIRLNAKTDPSLTDTRINHHIHRRIIKDYLEDLESRHIRWILK